MPGRRGAAYLALLLANWGVAGCGDGGTTSGEAGVVLESSESVAFEAHILPSGPGVNLYLARYLPPGGPQFSQIVFLCHGLGVNHLEYDLEAPHDLARQLAQLGFEVWSLSFRGAGFSSPTSLWAFSQWKFNFDDLIHADLDVALAYALATSGASEYFALGHSLGGIAWEAYLTTHPAAACKGTVLVAPGIFVQYPGYLTDPKRWALAQWATSAYWLIPPGLPLPGGTLAQGLDELLPPTVYDLTVSFLNFFVGPIVWSPENTSGGLASTAIRKVVANTASTVVRQTMSWAWHLDSFTYGPNPHYWEPNSSTYVAQNGFQSYSSKLPDFDVPQLWIAGAADYLIPSGMVAHAYGLSGAVDKTYVEASKANGFEVDYGHADLMVGQHTPQEIYPLIYEWLLARAN